MHYIGAEENRSRPLNRGGCFTCKGVLFTVYYADNSFGTLIHWPLNRGWSLSGGPLYKGSTVFMRLKAISVGVVPAFRLENAGKEPSSNRAVVKQKVK